MNDLNGLDWSSKPGTGQRTGSGNYSAFSNLKPSPAPASGRASPLAEVRPPSTSKSPTPAGDSFSNLVSFSSTNPNKNLSLQEQQKLREASKLQQLVGQKQKLQDQWAGNDDVWNSLGSGRSTPAAQTGNGTSHAAVKSEEDDLFAAFNQPASSKPTISEKAQPQTSIESEDDDPFGLAEFQARSAARPQVSQPASNGQDDDDILGDLGRPFVDKPKAEPRRAPPREPSPEREQELRSDHPQDKAVAELVDMGFPAEKARRALEATDTGMNVQAAVGLLLNQAHDEARQKSRGREQTPQADLEERPRRQRPTESQREREDTQRERSTTPSTDPAKAAQEFGAAFIKSAGSFWKTAQKQVQQAVSEFSSDTESGASTPKWMREVAAPSKQRQDDVEPKGKPTLRQQQNTATDEALMLETERPTPPPRQQARARPEHVFEASANSSRDHSPAMPSRLRESHSPQPAFLKQQDPLAGMMRPKAREPPRSTREVLNKQAADDQASQAYVSSNRRRKPATPIPTPSQMEGDLLDGASLRPSAVPQTLTSRPATRPTPPIKSATPIATRPPPPTRDIPQISAIALKASHTARSQGNTHFKRGDYSAAHEAYSTSLRHVPNAHPLQIVLLTNRALTALKTGQPKLAVVDADTAITLIGVSKGESETINVQDDDGKTAAKPMRDYYGKALMRKAEALENLEKWSEAAAVWRLCVEDGHGGATAIQGRARAERAAAPKPVAATAPARKPPPRVMTRSAPPSTKPAAAVSALRAQNQAAEKLDDEKFMLADTVSARLVAWKGGKEGNLRALLASLDTVLWEGAGWKKIGMADLVLPNKVKINYMKGIGKCHPDKIPTDATTEQRMIAGAVFSTLNEAWDKFKTENNM